MAKTAQAVYVPQWYEDASILNRVIAYTVGNRKVTEFAQLQEVVEHPDKFNYLYLDYQESLLNKISPNNPVTNEFFDSRFYRIGSRWMESSTTILSAYPSPGLVKFIGDVGTDEAELRKVIGGERGSKVHDALQHNRKVIRSDFNDDEWLLLMNAEAFYKQERPELILNEEAVWDEERGYACRLDRVVLMRGGKVTLIDFKTGYVGRTAWLQLASNKNAVQKTKGLHIDSWGILSLGAKVKAGWKYYSIEERTDVKDSGMSNEEAFTQDLAVFDATHFVWRDAFRSLKPKHFPYAPPDTLNLMIPVKLSFDLAKEALVERREIEESSAVELAPAPADASGEGLLIQPLGVQTEVVAPAVEGKVASPSTQSPDQPPAKKQRRSRNVAREEEKAK